ncbi:MAG TPA: class I SAM-dependent methyltransferase [Bryobacteraceae bacterium]|jgi:SAM-dependent methyltransferase|nr:class I SAM-dependent methyltransferase [Bryobacteraceae bacterium]
MKARAPRIKRNREYDPFARLYNRHWGADYRLEAAPIVDRLLLSRLRDGASVLDVCCGTGQFTEEIRRRGYELAGVDSSSEMIRYARRNAQGLDFTVADVRDFSLGRTFDAAYSVYESLNHIPEPEGLRMAFECVRRHLKPGAPFLFDLNREEAYILYWNNTDAIVEPDNAFITRSVYDEETKIGRCDVTTFDSAGNDQWLRKDFTLFQTCHSMTTAQTALHQAGFRNVTLQDARDIGMSGDAGYARTFFLAIA